MTVWAKKKKSYLGHIYLQSELSLYVWCGITKFTEKFVMEMHGKMLPSLGWLYLLKNFHLKIFSDWLFNLYFLLSNSNANVQYTEQCWLAVSIQTGGCLVEDHKEWTLAERGSILLQLCKLAGPENQSTGTRSLHCHWQSLG